MDFILADSLVRASTEQRELPGARRQVSGLPAPIAYQLSGWDLTGVNLPPL
ncbi:hypothetical protein [Kineobactrum salinum]|uniref:Uncharacterized protein n=1 Tax=Kineobactrum salinum TaxID=2708301 RepID=A0A6C0U0S9_9GAMM|nr:hypothetical protein [Kineobactrum salinum]QIB65710.1 hypothetical protein G3T16_10075 [Kineobactrum salinum]